MEENEQEIIFKIQNTNNYPVVMAQPDQLTLQQQQGEQWQRVRTLYCPCGASCPSPREFVELSPEAFTLLSWDKKESWCVHNTPQRIPETAEKPAEKGNYRLVVSCGQHPKTTHTIYYEFKLN
jgi:hypothetical protein